MKNIIRSFVIALTCIGGIKATAQVPLLNSFPSASAVIFLDFDGQTVANTSWNYSGTIYAAASGLNSSQITEIFNRVSEDYRPFNVNITTDSTKYLSAAATKRMRVIVTTTYSWYGSGAGGVSFVGSYTWGDNTPCWIFSSLLGYNVKYIAEASSHEAGHTLGLYHQASYDANCILTSQYNYGTGSGETSWAPIMGVGYYKNNTTWFNGPDPYGCNHTQDDLSIITTSNGFTYRSDDYSETFSGATSKTFSSNQFSGNGMISTPSDRDMFKFTLSNIQRVQLNVNPANVGSGDAGSNVDLSVELFNSSNTSIGYYNPASTLNVTIDTTLNAGTYYMRVDGVGNAYTTDYGSLGSYSILAQESPPISLPLRRLELHGELNGDQHQFTWIIDADEKVTEQVLEISTDGRNFNPVTQSPVNDRSFSYKPNINTTAQYRLNVTFDNGKQYYSNIVTIHAPGNVLRPQLASNLIHGNSFKVNSPGNYSYGIYDMSGKTIEKGQLITGMNNITSHRMSAGLYVIRFTNGAEQWVDKLINQ